jgi:MinD-like ATPase involved in chromosome partitioning or flagellar assembly
MTESRDQRFFEALNNTGRDDDDAHTRVPDTTGGGDPASPAAPISPQGPFADQELTGDPAGGRHHVDPPVGGVWGQPVQPPGDTAAPPWQNTSSPPPHSPAGPASSPDTPASPAPWGQKLEGPDQSLDASPLQAAPGFPDPTNEPTSQVNSTGAPAAGTEGLRDPGEAEIPPPPWSAQPGGQPTGGEQRQQPTPPGRPTPRPVPPEERTQFISREALRNSLGSNAAPTPPPPPPPPGWPAPGGAPQPGGWQRASQPPLRPRGPEAPPAEPVPPRGPRPPEWDWSQGTGGAELRSEQISASELNAPRKIPSSRGWRKWLYYGTFKLVNTGESPDEQLLRNLNATVAGHLRGTYSIVVLGGKGGVGKTTTTASIGSTFASLRKDKVIAIDANPDRASNLADRIDPKATNSYTDVLSDRNLNGYSDIRSHVGMNGAAGLDVLGNRHQPDRPPLTAQIYTETHAVLQRFYSVLISDSGTDVDHPVIPGLMGRADALIMVASTAPDGAKGAAELMDWAYEAGYHRLLQRTVVVINDVRGETGKAHRKLVDSLVEKFSRWVSPQRVFVVPFDPHIASAGVIDINELRPETRRRYLEITARLASGFNSSEGAQ